MNQLSKLRYTLQAFFVLAVVTTNVAATCCASQAAKDNCNFGSGGRCYWDDGACTCRCAGSPIIIDVDGNGYQLTSLRNGVYFDLDADGHVGHLAWTAAGSTNAFLTLDRNGNGFIDDGTELFGNFTPQPQSDHPNGFIALAEYDKPENGGNGDGVIDARDAIFAQLRLWQDVNHNAFSEPGELSKLAAKGIHRISLDYHVFHRRDSFGNIFRYGARVNIGVVNSTAGRWAYDVFFVHD